MTLNPNVNVDQERSKYADIFTPDDGYVLYRDNEDGNIDPDTGLPIMYMKMIRVPKKISEDCASHIWAVLESDIKDDTETLSEIKEKAAAYDILMGVSE